MKIPTLYVSGGQVERQLPHNFTVSVGAYMVRGVHIIRARDINAPLPGTITAANPGGTRPIAGVGEINQFEGSGKLHQEQMFIGFNSRLNPQFSVSGNYVLSKSTNDTDGQGAGSFPMNSYDLSGEFGRGGGDVRHRFSLFGTYTSKLWKLVFAPFVTASSAPPFNIFTGLDSNLDRVANNERPTFAALSTYCTTFPTRCTGIPLNGNTSNQIIPRNFGQASGSFTASLRITRTFGFGEVHRAGAANQSAKPATAGAGEKRGAGAPGSRGPMISTGGGGGERGGGGGGGMQGMGGGGGGATDKKYTLTVSLYVQNILNTVNLGNYVGNLSSGLFGQPQSVAPSFGFGGGGGSANAGNRRIYMNLRLNF
jgi:hypothetical protein